MIVCHNPHIEIHNKDFLHYSSIIHDESIAMIIFDITCDKNLQEMTDPVVFSYMYSTIFKRIIKPNGVILVFGTGLLYHYFIITNKDIFRYEIIWNKQYLTNTFTVNQQFGITHEHIAIFYKQQPYYKKIPYKEYNYTPSILQYIPDETHKKPITLLEHLITIFTLPQDIILDCCCQTGYTLIACKITQRQGIGFEKDYSLYNQAIAYIEETNVLF